MTLSANKGILVLTHSGFSHHNQFGESTFILGVLGAIFNFYLIFR